MKKFHKVICLLLASSVCMSFAGCGNKNKVADDGNVTTVTIWSPDSGSKIPMTKIIDEYNNTTGEEKGIKIEYIAKDSDYGQQLEVALQSGIGPDIYQSVNSEIYGGKGYCLALEDIEGGDELLAQYEDFEYPDWFVDKVTGKHYSVPYKQRTQGLIYNKEMFVKAGIVDENGEAKPPASFDEMREAAKKLTNVEKKEYGIVFPIKWTGWLESDVTHLAFADSGMWNGYNPATGEYDFSSTIPTMECIIGMKNDGSVYPGAETLDNDAARARFAEGGIGMKISASYDVAVFNTQFPAKFDWGVAPLPVSDPENCYMQAGSADGVGSINTQESTMKKIDKVFEVYKWLLSPEFAKRAYEDGISIPYRVSDIEGANAPEDLKGWKEFAELTKISVSAPNARKATTAGKKTMQEIYVDEVYAGKISPEEGAKEREQIVNDGIKAYLELYPDYDYTKILIPDWFEKVKR